MANDHAKLAFIYQRAAALNTLNELKLIIENMPTDCSDDQAHWGHVEAMNEINNNFCDLLRFASAK